MSRREFAQLKLSIWTDPDFTSLTPDAQLIYITALSHPTVNLAGVLDYVPAKFARLSKGMTAKRVQAAVAELEASRFVLSDDDTGELLVRSAVRSSGAWKKPTTAKSIVTDVGHTFSDPLRAVLRQELRRAVESDPAAADTTAGKVLLTCANDNSAVEESYTSSYTTPYTEPSMGTERERDRERDRDSAPKRATQLSDSWTPSDAHRQQASEKGIDVALEAAKMRDWAISKGESRKDWDATFRNWIRNARPTPGHTPKPPTGQRLLEEWELRG